MCEPSPGSRAQEKNSMTRLVDTTQNVRENEAHYDQSYRDVDRDSIVQRFADFDDFFIDAVKTDTSWVGLYQGGFADRLSGRRVLELGCGDGVNALAMAHLGAHVVAVDISSESARVVNETAARIDSVGDRVEAVAGDFTTLPFEPKSFDFIIGKAFLHHLTHELEAEYLARAAQLLRDDGEARFFEPAENNKTLDAIRWMIPMGKRPSSLNRAAFEQWQKGDPHPDRSNHWKDYLKVASKYFGDVAVHPLGSIERFHRLLPAGSFNRRYRRLAHRVDAKFPTWIRRPLARSQLLVYRDPKTDET